MFWTQILFGVSEFNVESDYNTRPVISVTVGNYGPSLNTNLIYFRLGGVFYDDIIANRRRSRVWVTGNYKNMRGVGPLATGLDRYQDCPTQTVDCIKYTHTYSLCCGHVLNCYWGQLYGSPSACEVTLKDIDIIYMYQNATRYNITWTACPFLGMYLVEIRNMEYSIRRNYLFTKSISFVCVLSGYTWWWDSLVLISQDCSPNNDNPRPGGSVVISKS